MSGIPDENHEEFRIRESVPRLRLCYRRSRFIPLLISLHPLQPMTFEECCVSQEFALRRPNQFWPLGAINRSGHPLATVMKGSQPSKLQFTPSAPPECVSSQATNASSNIIDLSKRFFASKMSDRSDMTNIDISTRKRVLSLQLRWLVLPRNRHFLQSLPLGRASYSPPVMEPDPPLPCSYRLTGRYPEPI
jgi:hypothetical protein